MAKLDKSDFSLSPDSSTTSLRQTDRTAIRYRLTDVDLQKNTCWLIMT